MKIPESDYRDSEYLNRVHLEIMAPRAVRGVVISIIIEGTVGGTHTGYGIKAVGFPAFPSFLLFGVKRVRTA